MSAVQQAVAELSALRLAQLIELEQVETRMTKLVASISRLDATIDGLRALTTPVLIDAIDVAIVRESTPSHASLEAEAQAPVPVPTRPSANSYHIGQSPS